MAWLYLPELSCAPASACLEKASVLHSDFSGTSTEPFATWSAKLLLPASLSRLWKRESLIQRLSGLTCSRSTAQRGADEWIASLPVSRAKIYPSPGGAPGSTANAPGSSFASATLPTIAVRNSSFWRTSAPSLLPPPPLWTKPKANSKSAPPPESWENWPTEGGTRNGSLFPRPKWEPATAEQDGFASHGEWLTPNVPNGGRSVPPEVVASKGMTDQGKRTVGLESQSRHWATPDCNISTRSNGLMGPNIREQAASWPTPMAQDSEQAGSTNASMMTLHRAASMFPTPSARDFKSEQGGGSNHESLQPTERPDPISVCDALGIFAPGPDNTDWPGIIDRFPHLAPATEPGVRGLVDGNPLVVDESRSHQLRAIGNGVVPLQAAVALVTLVRRSGIAID